MTLPATLLVLAVGGGPVAQGVYFSLLDYDLQRPWRTRVAGFGNYVDLWADPTNRHALINTILFTVSAVGIEFVAGLALALLLWRDGRVTRVALALLLIPVTLTPLAVGLLFRGLLTVDFGLIGYWARVLGLSGEHGFLGTTATALPTLVAIDAWQWTPLMALVLTAGLKAIPPEVVEAARIDGASGLPLLGRILLPMLLPTALVAVMIRAMDAFRVFDVVYATTQGGPDDATTTLMFQAVKQGLEFFQIGAASAISNLTILCIAVMVGTLLLLIRRANRRLHG
jgi:multiple sugar transport system permease protein